MTPPAVHQAGLTQGALVASRPPAAHVHDGLQRRRCPGAHTFFADGTSVPDWLIQLGHLREFINELKPRIIVPGHGAPGDVGMIDAQERYLRAVARMVEDYCRGGEVPLDDEAKAKLRQDIINEFPEYRNQIPLDISLQLIQMLGPLAFLVGRPDGATAPRLPSFL